MSVAPPPPPLFVLGAPAVGTSRVAAWLGTHPQLCAVPELNLSMADTVGELLDIAVLDAGPLLDGLLRALAVLGFGAQTDAAVEQARQWLQDRAGQATAEVLEWLVRQAAPRRLVVPDSGAALRPMDLLRLRRGRPDSYWLQVMRHPWIHGCVLAGLCEERLFVPPDYKDFSRKPPQLDPQIPWLRANLNLESALARLDGSARRQVCIEALEDSQDAARVAVLEWLSVAADALTLDAMDPMSWTFAGYGPRSAPYGLEAEALEPVAESWRERLATTALEGPLPWRGDEVGFDRQVLALANRYGYTE